MHSVLSLLLAHGVGGRSDLPISEWTAAWSGAIALLLSFAALGLLWHHPKFPQNLIGRLVPMPRATAQIFLLLAQTIAMAIFLVVLTACFFGPDNTVSNIAPTTIFIIFWVGMPLSASVLGPFWKAISPWENLCKCMNRIRPNSENVAPKWLTSGWLALVPITVFHWLELAYHHGSSPRVLGWCILIYTILLLLMTWRWGWEETRKIEGFGVLFSLAAAISPIFVDEKNKLRIRYPFVGISSLRMTPASVACLLYTSPSPRDRTRSRMPSSA